MTQYKINKVVVLKQTASFLSIVDRACYWTVFKIDPGMTNEQVEHCAAYRKKHWYNVKDQLEQNARVNNHKIILNGTCKS